MSENWPDDMLVYEIRIAQHSNNLDEIERFYCEGLGLKKVGEFRKHQGYDGIMIGLPDRRYHLEFTTHDNVSPLETPNKDNLLVLYIADEAAALRIAERLASMGYNRVDSKNPWWDEHGAITIEDPDKRCVVLQPGTK